MAEAEEGARRRAINLAGGAAGLSVPRLYFALLRQRFTGVLELKQGKPSPGARRVWLRGGMPLFTDWVSPDHVLGEILLSNGLVSESQYHQALQRMASEGGLLGHILLSLGHLDAAGLAEALRLQCQRKLVETFALTEGEAQVEAVEHERGHEDELRGQVNVLALIRQGIASWCDERRIREDMGDALDGDLVATPALAKYRPQFGFRPEDQPILTSLSRGTQLAALVRPGISIERALTVVYALWSCQMLRSGADASRAIAEGSTAGATPVEASAARAPTAAPARAPAPTTAATGGSRPAASGARSSSPPTASRSPTPAATPGGSERDFEQDLAALEAKVAAGANAFDLFGIDVEADRATIRATWAELSRRFHPDALEATGRGDLRARAEPIFASLSEAYGVLGDKEQRERLKTVLASGGTGRSGEDTSQVVRNALEAEMIAREGDKLLKRNNHARAAEAFRRALELSPADFDTKAALLWCEFQIGPRGANELTALLKNLVQVVEDQPSCTRAHFYCGLAYLAMKNDRLARESLKKALSLDPRMVEAERQLHAIQARMRQQSETKKSETEGLSLKNLFKRKS